MSEVMKSAIIFCDGACSGNPGPGGWAAIVVSAEGEVREIGGGARDSTNNRMELTASLEALRLLAHSTSPITVFTDSKYVIQGISSWIHSWSRNGWKTKDKRDVLNRDLWESLWEATRGKKIDWKYVEGHAGVPGNERVDELAVAFSQNESPLLFRGTLESYSVSLTVPASDSAAKPAKKSSSKSSSKNAFYLSLVGKKVARHATWRECEARVKGVPGAKFQKASSPEEEKAVLDKWGVVFTDS